MAFKNKPQKAAIYARIGATDQKLVDRARRKAGYSWGFLIGSLCRDWLAVQNGKEATFITRTKAERTANE